MMYAHCTMCIIYHVCSVGINKEFSILSLGEFAFIEPIQYMYVCISLKHNLFVEKGINLFYPF